jgi:hypothetical protein
MTTPQSTVIEKYQNLHSKYKVTTKYTVGIGHTKPEQVNLAPDTLELLFHLNNQSFNPSDYDQRSLIKITLYDKVTGTFKESFSQDTDNYMPAFDTIALTDFLDKHN